MAPTPAKPPTGARRGVLQRLTGKAGPLPVWAWALLILVAGYLVYRLTGAGKASSSSSDTSTASTDTTGGDVTGVDTGNPPASGQGSPADNGNADVLSQLTGLSGSVDALTGLVQSSPAFWPGSGDSGSGSTIPNDGGSSSSVPGGAAKVTTPTVKKPAAAPPAPAKLRYYTYAPGKAPKGKAAQQAPAKGPAGTKLRFARGKGYYYA